MKIFCKKMEERCREDGGNISRSWRKYLEKMEEISQEDGGKGRLINVGSCPQRIVHSFGHQRLHLLQKLLKSRNLYCFAKGTHCDPNLDGTWLQIRYHARFFPLRQMTFVNFAIATKIIFFCETENSSNQRVAQS